MYVCGICSLICRKIRPGGYDDKALMSRRGREICWKNLKNKIFRMGSLIRVWNKISDLWFSTIFYYSILSAKCCKLFIKLWLSQGAQLRSCKIENPSSWVAKMLSNFENFWKKTFVNFSLKIFSQICVKIFLGKHLLLMTILNFLNF